MVPGEVWRIQLADGFFRYAVVLSPTQMNIDLPQVQMAPLSAKLRAWPTRVSVKLKNRPRQVQCEIIQSIEKESLVEKVGELSLGQMSRVRQILRQMLSEI